MSEPAWQGRLYEIIFEAETPGGKAFDIALLLAIVLSVVAVSLESVSGIRARHGAELRAIEWLFTILFTIEYVLRLVCVKRPMRYALSFFGVVDLLAIAPTYLSVLLPGAQSLIVIRALRLLRVFRVMKLVHFVGEARLLRAALRASGRKIVVFLGTVLTVVLIVGALMYLIEGEEHGFTKILASAVMIIGYGIIAVPTGIVTVEIASAARRAVSTRACPGCLAEGHDGDAEFCKFCGGRL
jgi:voltage-gated potassium channel